MSATDFAAQLTVADSGCSTNRSRERIERVDVLSDVDAVRQATGGDELMLWTLGEPIGSQTSAWVSSDRAAVVVAGVGRSGRNRLGLWGRTKSLVPLATAARRIVGPAFRPIGSPHLVHALIEADGDLVGVPPFCWMQTREATVAESSPFDVVGLRDDDESIRDLLLTEFGVSHAMPGVAGIEYWVGIRDDLGVRLDAVGALAWSCPDVGFLSGIAVRRSAVGHGLGQSITHHLINRALKQRPVAALMVDADNRRARDLYTRSGLSTRILAAAYTRSDHRYAQRPARRRADQSRGTRIPRRHP